ncbi:hypothetical protein [Lysinibacillus sp. NPDC056232]|uniref:hypothetical protein n=1 Tax=Lysinibacillus sp. NPDC056232 TaxID=3345756 RepID=UPI0035E1921E
MQINLQYKGATREYHRQEAISNPNSTKGQALGGKNEIEVERDGKAYTLTLSDEVKYLKAMTEKEIAEMDMLSVNPDPSDIFSYRPQDQWLIFSQYLSDTGFFTGKDTRTIDEIENMLVDITDGLDNLDISQMKGRDIKAGRTPIAQELSSTEAQLELAASTTALKFFSEKYLTGDMKQGFDDLIDQYVKHNESRVINHASQEEKFYRGRAKVFEMRGMDTSTLKAERKKDLTITNKLGKTNYTIAEITEMIESYKEKFSTLKNQSEVDALMSQIQKQYLEFATKGISPYDKVDEAAKGFIQDKSEKTFNRIADYWKKLLE